MVSKKKVTKKTVETPVSQTEQILIENFIALQKVMTNLSVKFDSLNEQLNKLLQLFEISAKTMADKNFRLGESPELTKKMDTLLEQNKIIARGLALVHEKNEPMQMQQTMPPQTTQQMQQTPQQSFSPKPLPTNNPMQGYQKSISSQGAQQPPRP